MCYMSMYKSVTCAMYESAMCAKCANNNIIIIIIIIIKRNFKKNHTLVWVKIKSYATISRYLSFSLEKGGEPPSSSLKTFK